MIKIITNKYYIVRTPQRVFRKTDTIIIKEYNFGPKISDRIYAILLKIVNRKNAGFGCCTCGMWAVFGIKIYNKVLLANSALQKIEKLEMANFGHSFLF
jgi:hypothetical protein